MVYKDKGIEINMSNYIKLFIVQKNFEKIYGITKEEILNMYVFDVNISRRKYLK